MTDVQSCRTRLRARLIEFVRGAGVPVPDMAARLGVAPETVERWLAEPDKLTIERVADLMAAVGWVA